MKKILKGKIIQKRQVTKDVFELKFSSGLKSISPGQFLSILCPPKTLRRPFGVADFENGVLTVLIKQKGEGTKYLSSLNVGDEIQFLAPLGKGFNVENKNSLLIGAGIGIAPLLYLNKELKKIGAKTLLMSGFKSEEDVIAGADKNKISGSILDEVSRYIKEFKPEKIYSCGPEVVLKAISKLDIETEIAMEKLMACGIGVCRGCVIKLKKDGQVKNATICHDGPVFKGSEVIWQT